MRYSITAFTPDFNHAHNWPFRILHILQTEKHYTETRSPTWTIIALVEYDDQPKTTPTPKIS